MHSACLPVVSPACHPPSLPADNVGDNVGDIAGMGADLFGSFAESTCAALVVSSGACLLSRGGGGGWVTPCPLAAAELMRLQSMRRGGQAQRHG